MEPRRWVLVSCVLYVVSSFLVDVFYTWTTVCDAMSSSSCVLSQRYEVLAVVSNVTKYRTTASSVSEHALVALRSPRFFFFSGGGGAVQACGGCRTNSRCGSHWVEGDRCLDRH